MEPVRCPFCGAAETDRFTLEGRRFLVFACMFTPEVPTGIPEAEVAGYVRANFPASGARGYFRGMCDRMHLFVTQGEGARALTAPPAPSGGPADP